MLARRGGWLAPPVRAGNDVPSGERQRADRPFGGAVPSVASDFRQHALSDVDGVAPGFTGHLRRAAVLNAFGKIDEFGSDRVTCRHG